MRTTSVHLLLAPVLALTGLAPVAAAEPGQPETVAALFERIDKNRDGKLSREETNLLPAIAERFATLDKDNDGFLTLEEFAAGVRPDGGPLSRTPNRADQHRD